VRDCTINESPFAVAQGKQITSFPLLPGHGVRVEIPAGEDDSDSQVFSFNLAMKGGGCGDGA